MREDLSKEEMISRIENLESELSLIHKTWTRMNSLFNAMSEGVCLHEVIYDTSKKPVDYRIIDVNPAYEKITNIKKEEAVEKNASIVYGTNEPPFLDIYSRVVETGVPESFEVYWPPMKKHFNISVFSPEKGQFATVFLDITRQKDQENALRLTNERLSTTLNSIGDGVITTDEYGNITHMNPVAEEITGWSTSEAKARPLLECFRIINQTTGSDVDNPVFRVIREGKIVGLANHTILISKDGTKYNIDDSASPIRNEKGELSGVVLIFRDITEKYKSENALRLNEARLRSIFRAVPTGIGLVSERKIFEVNDKLCEITGYSKEDLINQNSRMLYPSDEDYDYVGKEKYRQISKYGTGTIETRFKRKDGRIIDILMSSTPIDSGDLKAGVTFTALDITERRLALDALIESEKKYRRLTENSPDMIYRMSLPDGRYEYVNPAAYKLTGYKPEEWYQNTMLIKKIIHADWHQYFNEQWELLLKGQIPTIYEFQIIHKNGEIRWLNQRNILITDDEGKPIAIEGIATDISDQKKLETQLIQTQKMESIGTLAGGIAHDFNNMLSPIMISAELAMMTLPDDSPVQNDLRSIYRAGERARDLVRQILTFARKSDEKKVKLHAIPLVLESLKFLRSIIPTTIDIQHEINTGNDLILADKTRMNQIIMNLFTNAAHAMRNHGGILKITLTDEHLKSDNRIIKSEGMKPGHYLSLAVSDTGEGIPPEVINKIFEPYYTAKAAGEGTGMGLAVVHGIVKHYDGSITVESTVGKGTVFYVYLPLTEDDIPESKTTDNNLFFGSERILYIDDEMALITPVKKMLEKLGYRVTANNSSLHALELFKNNPNEFDLVITDQTMPHMTGKELTKHIKSIRSDIPVILCTGYSDQINEKSARDMGINAFVLKPIIIRDISRIIRDVLDKKS